jgi:hypothetical protein
MPSDATRATFIRAARGWRRICGGWAVMLAVLLSLPAQADEALVTLVQGVVRVSVGQQPHAPVTPFMKLRAGDRLELADAARVRLLYGQTGRQETWNGAVVLQVGAGATTRVSGTAQAEVKQVPSAALTRLARADDVLADMRTRTGMVVIRSGGLLEQLREAESVYRELRAQAADDDVAPELYLVSALYELKLYKDIPEVIEDILCRQPGNPVAAAILENLRGVTGR